MASMSFSPLHFAVCGHYEYKTVEGQASPQQVLCCEYLLQNGAGVLAKDKLGRTPFDVLTALAEKHGVLEKDRNNEEPGVLECLQFHTH
jgi:hypothetical protein